MPFATGGPLLFLPSGSRGSFQMNNWPPDPISLGSFGHRQSVDEISHFPSLSSDTEGGSHGGSFSGPSSHVSHGSGSISHPPFLGIPFFQDTRANMSFFPPHGDASQPLPSLSSQLLSSSHDSEVDHIGGEPQRALTRSGWLYPPHQPQQGPPQQQSSLYRSSNEIGFDAGTPLSPPTSQQQPHFAPFSLYYPMEFRSGPIPQQPLHHQQQQQHPMAFTPGRAAPPPSMGVDRNLQQQLQQQHHQQQQQLQQQQQQHQQQLQHHGSISSVASTRSDITTTEDTRDDHDGNHHPHTDESFDSLGSPYISMHPSPTSATRTTTTTGATSPTATTGPSMRLRSRRNRPPRLAHHPLSEEGILVEDVGESGGDEDGDDDEEEYFEVNEAEDEMEEEEQDEEEAVEGQEATSHRPARRYVAQHPTTSTMGDNKLDRSMTRASRRGATPSPMGPSADAATTSSLTVSPPGASGSSLAATVAPTAMRASQGGGRGTSSGSLLLSSAAAHLAPERHKGSGRKKIDIKPIPYKLKRQITFSKRKTGLLKKVKELTTLTQTDALVILVSETGNPHSYATKRFQDMIRNADMKTLNSFLDLEEKRTKSGKGH